MGLESATYINGLVATNPIGASDAKAQGDDHIRLLKSTILATFPNITGAVTVTHTNLNGILDASNLTSGLLPDARLSSNVPLKNTVGGNIFTTNLEIDSANPQYRYKDTGNPVDGKDWYTVVDGATFYLVATSDGFVAPVLIPLQITRNLVASITSFAITADSVTYNGVSVFPTVPVANGGTGGTTAATARTGLGVGSMAQRDVTIQSGGSPSGGADGDIFLIY